VSQGGAVKRKRESWVLCLLQGGCCASSQELPAGKVKCKLLRQVSVLVCVCVYVCACVFEGQNEGKGTCVV
jgi:hypothetical protein